MAADTENAARTTLTVVRTLGEGAFGEVKLVVDSKNPRYAVAMKCVDLVRHGDAIDAVRKEALLQRMLRGHRNIIQYIGMRLEQDTTEFQLFLEYADGGELFDQIEPDVGMASAKAQFYFRQLIEGVKYIHSKGICHRDIKPENILLTQNDVLKISDFGMATIFRHDGRERLLSTCCGTLPYASPQVVNGYYRAEPSDLWSCGVVLVTMLAGELPWGSASKKNEAFCDWVSGTRLDENPWKKVGNVALSLLRSILKEDEGTRANVARIQSHPWYTSDFIKNKGSRMSRIRSEVDDSADSKELPFKKRRCAANAALEVFPRSSDSISQPSARLNDSSIDDLLTTTSNDSETSLVASSFSQPENFEELLLNHSQIDTSLIHCIDPFQLLVRRMTRFCVTVSVADAVREIIDACEACGYEVKKRTLNQLSVGDRRDMSFLVATYEMNKNGRKAVMIDFRRSRGDGLEFKRAFVTLKRRLASIICRRSTDWLESQGLVCSQAFSNLSVDV